MSGVTTATVIAGVTAAAAVAGTVYTIAQSSNARSAAPAPAPVQMPAVPEVIAPPAAEPIPTKKTAVPDGARGSSSTVLTGGLGDTSDVATKKKTLLGQ